MSTFNPFQLPERAIIAHRGASAHAPENTLAAFRLALEHGAHAIELDALLTRDGEVAVIHDNILGRTTDGRGAVKALEWADLQSLDAGRWFNGDFAGERIPHLRAVLQAVAPHITVNIELKNDAAPFNALAEQVSNLIRETNTAERVFISSFNPLALRRFHQLQPEIPIGLLALGGGAGLGRVAARFVPHDALHPHQRAVTPPLVARAHAAGKRVHAYTVNAPEDMRRLFALGVNGIFTDDPRLAITIRSQYEQARR